MYKYTYNGYDTFFLYAILVALICVVIVAACYLIGTGRSYYEKTSGYECGFDPFSDAREPFSVKFYLIAILYIIFDVETIFFLPACLCVHQIGIFGFFMFYTFVMILTIGFVYEWKKSAIEFA